ncbi:MAG: SGNH/GDSL hydrolase family protein [Chloroflexi bacterium]|nr:SGNH/GDSL hydrolase family protein [Chloroflexota bacterium]
MKRRFTNALLGCLGLVIALVLLEVIIRIGGATGADGQFSFRGYPLEPYVLPVQRLHDAIDVYIENEDSAAIVYDETTGWAYRPNSIRQEGAFTINEGGIRSQADYDQRPRPDTLRIAAFGDSFVAGDDVNDDQVWTKRLEIELNRTGLRTEVLNFGVGAFGMDQAYLRWQKLGSAYDPDIVVFGFQPENLDRNVNVFRLLRYRQGGIPFSKPRFVLQDNKLVLYNMPTLTTFELKAAFSSFSSNPLAKFEAFYNSREFVSNWWMASRLASFIHALAKAQGEADAINYAQGSERGELGKAIVDAFAASVKGSGAEFFVVHLPRRTHLQNLQDGEVSPFSYLLNHINENYRFVDTVDHLGSEYTERKYWGATYHYGPEVNHLVAWILAGEIAACVKNSSCRLPRFAHINAILASP